MLDEQDPDASFPTASFSASRSMPAQGQQALPTLAPAVVNPNNSPQHSMPPPQQLQQGSAAGEQHGMLTGGPSTAFEQYDPVLDADPFGLSASMYSQSSLISYDCGRKIRRSFEERRSHGQLGSQVSLLLFRFQRSFFFLCLCFASLSYNLVECPVLTLM
jgi:hypothetical protein